MKLSAEKDGTCARPSRRMRLVDCRPARSIPISSKRKMEGPASSSADGSSAEQREITIVETAARPQHHDTTIRCSHVRIYGDRKSHRSSEQSPTGVGEPSVLPWRPPSSQRPPIFAATGKARARASRFATAIWPEKAKVNHEGDGVKKLALELLTAIAGAAGAHLTLGCIRGRRSSASASRSPQPVQRFPRSLFAGLPKVFTLRADKTVTLPATLSPGR